MIKVHRCICKTHVCWICFIAATAHTNNGAKSAQRTLGDPEFFCLFFFFYAVGFYLNGLLSLPFFIFKRQLQLGLLLELWPNLNLYCSQWCHNIQMGLFWSTVWTDALWHGRKMFKMHVSSVPLDLLPTSRMIEIFRFIPLAMACTFRTMLDFWEQSKHLTLMQKVVRLPNFSKLNHCGSMLHKSRPQYLALWCFS